MSEELLVNVTPQETRVAVLENGSLQEVHVERTSHRGFVGNIYKGRVVRVLPGMQAVFVDIGLQRTAFLHTSDMVAQRGEKNLPAEKGDTRQNVSSGPPDIVRLTHEGQELVVQVVKDPIGSKGARLTTQLSLPSRHLVLLPGSDHLGVSQRIQNPEERDRLRQVLNDAMRLNPVVGGFIVRTVAESVEIMDLTADLDFLQRSWQRIEAKIPEAKAGDLIHEDLPLTLRMVRDLASGAVERVRVDSRESFESIRRFANDLFPEVAPRIEYYSGERPIFDLYSIEEEIQRALERTVQLKSGGLLVVDQTEAMTTIDVNTGAFVGRRNLEDTIFRTNLEAAQSIVRQLRLRNIGGIIIVDFIDMADEEHRRQVMRAFERLLSRDRTPCSITDMSGLGLVEITRKRTRESLERMMTESCPVCDGRGTQKTPQTVCYEIFREVVRQARAFDAKGHMILAAQVVIDMLIDEEATALADLREFVGRPVHLQVEPAYSQEIYDVVLM